MHRYRCAGCGQEFESEEVARKCPACRGRVLVHLEGEKPRSKGACGGNCQGCAGCGGMAS